MSSVTPFIHLHTHSHYSLLDGLSKIDELVELAKKDNMPALAITDHGNLYGAIEFYKKAKKAGVKPILGVEAYVAERTRFDKEPNIDSKRYHLTLLAKNSDGYKNLVKLVTKAHLEGYYYKPRMDRELIREHSEGLVCLSGCFGSEVSSALRAKNFDKAKKIAGEYRDIFGDENYFIEIMHHSGVAGHDDNEKDLVKLAREMGLRIVATQDSHYARPEDKKAHETLLSVQSTGSGAKKFSFGPDDFSFINTKQAYEYFSHIPEAVENTFHISEMVNIELELGTWAFPNYKSPDGKTAEEDLRELTNRGLKKRKMEETEEVRTRIDYELGIIHSKGYDSYFLVVSDLFRFAKEQEIPSNTRGSAAGSLVSYLIGITNVDPLHFRLPFERFLNPERPSLPDIDMDFADDRRDEVIQYSRDKYGNDSVAQIGTFGTMLAKGSVRDVARALEYPYSTGDRISSMIPLGSQGFPMTIDRAMEMVPELLDAYEKESDTKEIIDLAKKLEGCVRHISVHAAGVVISPTVLTDYVPVQHDPKGGKIITQYDMHAVEDAGLPKFDFLGLKNLTILSKTVQIVKQIHGIKIDLDAIPLDDKKTFEMLARGETMGVFQLGGSGMTRYLKELKPARIEDINAMVALYRPGPMAFIPEYIKRKENPRLTTYLDPRLEPILKSSYGIITYQDDVLLTAIELAGYSWGEADKFRKAIGKKIPGEMEAQKEKFMNGCASGGMPKKKVKELWDMIETFAAYGFNKSHAASYGHLAYQTAYMKANYPSEYMAAVLTADSGNTEEVAVTIGECERMNVPVLPPDVNESFADFTVVKAKGETNNDKIRFGLTSIKNLGTDIANAIIDERERDGKYESYANFLERVRHKNLNKKSLEALVMCGAMEKLGERGQMLGNMEESLAYNRLQSNENAEQLSLFELMKDTSSVPTLTLKPFPDATQKEKLGWEKELLGLYISGHPLDEYKEKLDKREWKIKTIKEKLKDGMVCVPAGIVDDVRAVVTKKGDRMAFIKLTDMTDTIEVVAFPRIFEQCKDILTPEKIIAIRGKYSTRNGESSVIAEAVKELS